MNAPEKKERQKIKTKMVSFKCSPAFAELLKELAQKKGMSQSNLIEYITRKEADRNNIES